MSIFTRAFNKLGGYDSLAERFPGGPEPQGQRWERRCVEFGGSMRYDWCVTIVAAADGLWLQARPPAQGTQAAIFVPWAGDPRGAAHAAVLARGGASHLRRARRRDDHRVAAGLGRGRPALAGGVAGSARARRLTTVKAAPAVSRQH